MSLKVNVKPRVGQRNQAEAYEHLEHVLRQRRHYESLVHEQTAKVEEAKARLARYLQQLDKFQKLEPEARAAVDRAKADDRLAAKEKLKALKEELARLEAQFE